MATNWLILFVLPSTLYCLFDDRGSRKGDVGSLSSFILAIASAE